MSDVVDLLERPLYGFLQVDHLLGLRGGTAARWINGYSRGGKFYDPVIRPEATGSELATWGEFVETRLLSEYRDAGVPLIRMRPAIERLRHELDTPYPLASARMWLRADGQELVRAVQEGVGLDRELALVEVRTGQVVGWAKRTEEFLSALTWSSGEDAEIIRLHPVTGIDEVVIDPVRGFGEPVVRGVRTEIISELIRAGESTDSIAAMYELPRSTVDAAIRYELSRAA